MERPFSEDVSDAFIFFPQTKDCTMDIIILFIHSGCSLLPNFQIPSVQREQPGFHFLWLYLISYLLLKSLPLILDILIILCR